MAAVHCEDVNSFQSYGMFGQEEAIIEQRLMGRTSSRMSKTRKKEGGREMSRAGGQCSQVVGMMFDVMAVVVRRSILYLFLWQTEAYEPVLTSQEHV